MDNLTKNTADGWRISAAFLEQTPEGFAGIAAERLAAFECIRGELECRQSVLSAEIERLYLAGKQKHYKTKELLAEKLTNGSILSYLDRKGL